MDVFVKKYCQKTESQLEELLTTLSFNSLLSGSAHLEEVLKLLPPAASGTEHRFVKRMKLRYSWCFWKKASTLPNSPGAQAYYDNFLKTCQHYYNYDSSVGAEAIGQQSHNNVVATTIIHLMNILVKGPSDGFHLDVTAYDGYNQSLVNFIFGLYPSEAVLKLWLNYLDKVSSSLEKFNYMVIRKIKTSLKEFAKNSRIHLNTRLVFHFYLKELAKNKGPVFYTLPKAFKSLTREIFPEYKFVERTFECLPLLKFLDDVEIPEVLKFDFIAQQTRTRVPRQKSNEYLWCGIAYCFLRCYRGVDVADINDTGKAMRNYLDFLSKSVMTELAEPLFVKLQKTMELNFVHRVPEPAPIDYSSYSSPLFESSAQPTGGFFDYVIRPSNTKVELPSESAPSFQLVEVEIDPSFPMITQPLVEVVPLDNTSIPLLMIDELPDETETEVTAELINSEHVVVEVESVAEAEPTQPIITEPSDSEEPVRTITNPKHKPAPAVTPALVTSPAPLLPPPAVTPAPLAVIPVLVTAPAPATFLAPAPVTAPDLAPPPAPVSVPASAPASTQLIQKEAVPSKLIIAKPAEDVNAVPPELSMIEPLDEANHVEIAVPPILTIVEPLRELYPAQITDSPIISAEPNIVTEQSSQEKTTKSSLKVWKHKQKSSGKKPKNNEILKMVFGRNKLTGGWDPISSKKPIVKVVEKQKQLFEFSQLIVNHAFENLPAQSAKKKIPRKGEAPKLFDISYSGRSLDWLDPKYDNKNGIDTDTHYVNVLPLTKSYHPDPLDYNKSHQQQQQQQQHQHLQSDKKPPTATATTTTPTTTTTATPTPTATATARNIRIKIRKSSPPRLRRSLRQTKKVSYNEQEEEEGFQTGRVTRQNAHYSCLSTPSSTKGVTDTPDLTSHENASHIQNGYVSPISTRRKRVSINRNSISRASGSTINYDETSDYEEPPKPHRSKKANGSSISYEKTDSYELSSPKPKRPKKSSVSNINYDEETKCYESPSPKPKRPKNCPSTPSSANGETDTPNLTSHQDTTDIQNGYFSPILSPITARRRPVSRRRNGIPSAIASVGGDDDNDIPFSRDPCLRASSPYSKRSRSRESTPHRSSSLENDSSINNNTERERSRYREGTPFRSNSSETSSPPSTLLNLPRRHGTRKTLLNDFKKTQPSPLVSEEDAESSYSSNETIDSLQNFDDCRMGRHQVVLSASQQMHVSRTLANIQIDHNYVACASSEERPDITHQLPSSATIPKHPYSNSTTPPHFKKRKIELYKEENISESEDVKDPVKPLPSFDKHIIPIIKLPKCDDPSPGNETDKVNRKKRRIRFALKHKLIKYRGWKPVKNLTNATVEFVKLRKNNSLGSVFKTH